MFQLVCGPDRLENSRYLIDRICELARQGIGGQILIVPEQYSHETERALLKTGGDSISAYAEVLSFSRLASRVFSVYGGISREYLDEGGRMLCLYLAAQNVLSELKVYAGSATRPEFLIQLGSVIEEWLSSCLMPQDILNCAKRTEGQFAQKLQELGILFESYLSVCKTGRQDPITKQLRLAEILQEQPYADGKRFYLDGFSDFTGIQMQIMQTLMQSSEELTLSVTTDGSSCSAFSCANETLHRVRKMADRWNVQTNTVKLGCFNGRSEALSCIQSNAFAKDAALFEKDTEDVRFISVPTVEDECRFAAKTIRELVMKGERFRDVSIAVTDPVYLPQLKLIFAKAGLAAYFAGSEDILQQPLLADVLCALQAADRFEYDDMLQFLKSAWSVLDEDAVDAVEQYAHLWSIRGKAWCAEWTMHPRGYGEKWEQSDRAVLAQLEMWRKASVSPLEQLHKALYSGENVKFMILALTDFLEKIGLSDTLETQTQDLIEDGRSQQAQKTAQLYEILIGALEQMYRTVGECRMDAQQFIQIMKLLLGCYQVGTIPAGVDEIQIGPVMSMRHSNVRNMIVLGAEDGKLPEYSIRQGLLSDSERQQLQAMGLQIAPDQEQSMERELGWAYAAVSGARKRLIFVRSSEQPAWLSARIRRLFPNCADEKLTSVSFLPNTASVVSELLQRGQHTQSWVPKTLQEQAEKLDGKRNYRFLPLKMQTVQGLYGNPLALSASKIDRFASCRFAYFMNYGLKAEPWKKAAFDAPIFGTFVHYVLECTVREVSENGGFRGTDDAALEKIAQHYVDDYVKTWLPDLSSRGQQFVYLFNRNLEEVRRIVLDVGRELRKTRFVPADEELSFDNKDGLPPVRIDGKLGTGLLSGKVDRVDIYQKDGKTYFRVIDYKSGTKDFDYADILLGKGLQMLLYLFALRHTDAGKYGRNPEPAGVLYVPSINKMVPLDSAEQLPEAERLHRENSRRKGLVRADRELLLAMEEDENPEYLPVTKKKDEYSGSLASKEQMDMLADFVTERVAEMTDDMLRGCVGPNPIIHDEQNSSCRYCDYQQACHKDFCPHENRYIRAVKQDRFWEEIERRQRNG